MTFSVEKLMDFPEICDTVGNLYKVSEVKISSLLKKS